MSARNLIFRQQPSEESITSNIIASSPSLSSSLQRFNFFRNTENLSSQIGQIVSNASSVATGAVTGTSMTDHAEAASTDSGTPKKRKSGE